MMKTLLQEEGLWLNQRREEKKALKHILETDFALNQVNRFLRKILKLIGSLTLTKYLSRNYLKVPVSKTSIAKIKKETESLAPAELSPTAA